MEAELNVDELDQSQSPGSKVLDKQHDVILHELEERGRQGDRLLQFYQRYNPDRIQYLGSLLDRYVGKEEALCQELRNKYNADFYGEYPPEQQQEGGGAAEPVSERVREHDERVPASSNGEDTEAGQERRMSGGPSWMDQQIFEKRLINFYAIHDPSLISTVKDKVTTLVVKQYRHSVHECV